jgi:hypothetical protein
MTIVDRLRRSTEQAGVALVWETLPPCTAVLVSAGSIAADCLQLSSSSSARRVRSFERSRSFQRLHGGRVAGQGSTGRAPGAGQLRLWRSESGDVAPCAPVAFLTRRLHQARLRPTRGRRAVSRLVDRPVRGRAGTAERKEPFGEGPYVEVGPAELPAAGVGSKVDIRGAHCLEPIHVHYLVIHHITSQCYGINVEAGRDQRRRTDAHLDTGLAQNSVGDVHDNGSPAQLLRVCRQRLEGRRRCATRRCHFCHVPQACPVGADKGCTSQVRQREQLARTPPGLLTSAGEPGQVENSMYLVVCHFRLV